MDKHIKSEVFIQIDRVSFVAVQDRRGFVYLMIDDEMEEYPAKIEITKTETLETIVEGLSKMLKYQKDIYGKKQGPDSWYLNGENKDCAKC